MFFWGLLTLNWTICPTVTRDECSPHLANMDKARYPRLKRCVTGRHHDAVVPTQQKPTKLSLRPASTIVDWLLQKDLLQPVVNMRVRGRVVLCAKLFTVGSV